MSTPIHGFGQNLSVPLDMMYQFLQRQVSARAMMSGQVWEKMAVSMEMEVPS